MAQFLAEAAPQRQSALLGLEKSGAAPASLPTVAYPAALQAIARTGRPSQHLAAGA